MLTAYFKLSMNLVRDVVKIMEEGIMENFDDEASKPVSSVFAAPIPSSNNNFDEKEKKEKGSYDDGGFIEDDYSEINVSTGDLNISYEKPKEKKNLTNEVIYENVDADIIKINKKLNISDINDENNKNEVHSPNSNKKNNVSLVIPPNNGSTSNSTNNSALASASTSTPSSSNPFNKLKQKRSSVSLSADTSSALQTQANLITKINKKHHYEVLRRSNNIPIMEAMSQDTIEEVVNKTFTLANAKNNDYLTFEEFQKVAESDITILAWFEALGSVF